VQDTNQVLKSLRVLTNNMKILGEKDLNQFEMSIDNDDMGFLVDFGG
jgi:hypothetical protein